MTGKEREPQPEFGIVAQGSFETLRELKAVLQRGGVRAEMVPPPKDPERDWGTLLLLAVASADFQEARRLVHEHWAKDLPPEARASLEMTVDLDAEETACPACMTPMPGGSTACPECGLRFG